MIRSKLSLFFSLVFFSAAFIPLTGQGIDLNEVNAKEDFRWGVIAYNKANYNDAIRSFERALSLKPDEILYQEWLGNALFRSGFVTAAEGLWSTVLARNPDPLLNSRLEIQRLRSGLGPELSTPEKYVVSGVLTGAMEEGVLFRRPSSLYPLKDGGFLTAAFGSNEVLSFDINGAVRGRLTGGLEKFSGPFDVLQAPSGDIFLTEYGADRITRANPFGTEYFRFGGRGRGDGQFLGPQYMAMDPDGYLYITDFGNHRVVKMDQEGEFILSFGHRRNGIFPGLLEPTGIAVEGEEIYVADARRKALFVFDSSGNYLRSLAEGRLSRPEGLSSGYPGELILVDDGRIYSFDLEMETMLPLADLRGGNSRILKAARDENGNILAVDFNGSRINFLTDVSQVYTGLSVRIDRIVTEEFPRIVVDLTVEDPLGSPIIGLSERNFVFTELSEGRHNPEAHSLLFQGNLSRTLHTALLVDRSPEMDSYRDDVRNAVAELYDSLEGASTLRTVTAGEVPLVAAPYGTSREGMIRAAAGDPSELTGEGRFDLALRLAAGEIITGRGHRAILFLSQGKLGPKAFEGYGVLDLVRYLKNNGIRFYVLSTSRNGEMAPELSFLCQETGGESLFLYRPQGLKGFFDEMVSVPDGTYTLEYRSLVEGDFGRQYIPFQAEVLLYNRSGREKSGYFAPARY